MRIEAVVVSKTVVESTHFGPRVDGKKDHENLLDCSEGYHWYLVGLCLYGLRPCDQTANFVTLPLFCICCDIASNNSMIHLKHKSYSLTCGFKVTFFNNAMRGKKKWDIAMFSHTRTTQKLKYVVCLHIRTFCHLSLMNKK